MNLWTSFSALPFDELTCSSEESGITSGFFSSPSPSSSLWLPPPLLLLEPGEPLYRIGFDVIFSERWASDWPLLCRCGWWWWCRGWFWHFDRRSPIRMAQPPISRADVMPMAIDIVGVSDRYNLGRSAGNEKHKCTTKWTCELARARHAVHASPTQNMHPSDVINVCWTRRPRERDVFVYLLFGTYHARRSIVFRAVPA